MLLMSIASRMSTHAIRPIALISSAALLSSVIYLIPTAIANCRSYDRMIEQITDNSPIIIVNNVKLNSMQERYIVPVSRCAFGNNIVEHKDVVINYYGGDTSSEIIPEYILTANDSKPHDLKRLYFKSWRMSWIRLPDDATVDSVSFRLRPVTEKWKQPFMKFFERLRIDELATESYRTVTLPGNASRWLVVYDNSAIATRVCGINVRYHTGR